MNALLIGTNERVRESVAWLLWMEGIENIAVADLGEAAALLGLLGACPPFDLLVLDARELDHRKQRFPWVKLRECHPALPAILLGKPVAGVSEREPRLHWADPFEPAAIQAALAALFPQPPNEGSYQGSFYPIPLPNIPCQG